MGSLHTARNCGIYIPRIYEEKMQSGITIEVFALKCRVVVQVCIYLCLHKSQDVLGQ